MNRLWKRIISWLEAYTMLEDEDEELLSFYTRSKKARLIEMEFESDVL